MKQNFVDSLSPMVQFLAGLSPSDDNAANILNKTFPIDSQEMKDIANAFAKGIAEGWLCDRDGGPGLLYSRVAKDIGQSKFSIDAVRMDRPGPGHTHPEGEFDLCFAVDGDPRFDGQKAGWTAYPPKSWHIPTVRGGTMNILYFLPGGVIEFGPKAE